MDNSLQTAKVKVGYTGEYFTLFRLAQLGIVAEKMSNIYDFDIMTAEGTRIEVKTARQSVKYNSFIKQDGSRTPNVVWQFANHTMEAQSVDGKINLKFSKRDRSCDFFVFVCLDSDGLHPLQTYVVPKASLTPAQSIMISTAAGTVYEPFLEAWRLITDFEDSAQK